MDVFLDHMRKEGTLGKYRLVAWSCPSGGWTDEAGNHRAPVGAVFQMTDEAGKCTNVKLETIDAIKPSRLAFAAGDKQEAIDRIENQVPLHAND